MKILTKLQSQFFFLFLFVFVQLSAQSPWPKTGTTWWYFGGDLISGPQLMMLEAVGDEVYQGRLSQKIQRTIVDFDGNSTPLDAYYAYQENEAVYFYSEAWNDYIMTFDNKAAEGEILVLKNPTTRTGPDSLLTIIAPGPNRSKKKNVLTEYQKSFIQQYFIFPSDLNEWQGFGDADALSNNLDGLTPFYNYEDRTAYKWAKDIDDINPINNVMAFSGAVLGRIWINFAIEFENLDFKITNAVGKQITRGRLYSPDQEIVVGRLRPGRYYLHFPGSNIKAQKFDVW